MNIFTCKEYELEQNFYEDFVKNRKVISFNRGVEIACSLYKKDGIEEVIKAFTIILIVGRYQSLGYATFIHKCMENCDATIGEKCRIANLTGRKMAVEKYDFLISTKKLTKDKIIEILRLYCFTEDFYYKDSSFKEEYVKAVEELEKL